MSNELWRGTLDEIYVASVVRTGPYEGLLSISKDGEALGSCPVTLAYGASFGPDAGNVHDWQEWATAFVDDGHGPIIAMEPQS